MFLAVVELPELFLQEKELELNLQICQRGMSSMSRIKLLFAGMGYKGLAL